ncbi:MAG: histone deacetylase family protein [Bdellovibrionales bacterium]|nr:histone deacetylase family protein [Bdellovibrionales bacterium]
MFRIRQIYSPIRREEQKLFAAVLRIYRRAFSYYPEYAAKIADLFREPDSKTFEPVLLVAEGPKERILGFSLSFYFPEAKAAYLDYLAADPARKKRGYGAAVYEATREHFRRKPCIGIFMDVPPDAPELLKEPERLAMNKRRLEFYERFGARPIVNTAYEKKAHKGNQGYVTFLVYDSLDQGKNPSRAEVQATISCILGAKAQMPSSDPTLRAIVKSVKDDPIQLRPPLYSGLKNRKAKAPTRLSIDIVCSGDSHQIHHLKERGYVERPARVSAILRGLHDISYKEHPLRHFGEKYITAIHDKKLVHFLREAQDELSPDRLVYPNVFPLRQQRRLPRTWEMRAGYFCLDTFTPVTRNAYKAARLAVDAALTGASLIKNGSQRCYVLCRPPGHHAEKSAFGGFCYFNNAAVAAEYLSKDAKVALLDIDYHHGNGSQNIFYERKDVYVVSIHGNPRQAYPYFCGFEDETGKGPGQGYNRNYPLFPPVDDALYLKTLQAALRSIAKFKPKYFVLSLGYDIMSGDPTGTFDISRDGMRSIGQMFSSVGVPLLIVQEGGYSLRNLRVGANALLRGLLS